MLYKIINKQISQVLHFLCDHPDFDYNMSDIHRQSKVSRPTLYKLLDNLVKEKLIYITRTTGKSKMYRVNIKSPTIQSIIRSDFIESEAEKEAKEN